MASLHIGWGSFRNLDIVAARGSGAALLLDINVHQFRVWRAVLAALQLAQAPTRFVETVVPMLPRRPGLRQFSDDTREWLLTETRREGSWLQASRPERYAHIRKLAVDGMIAVGCLDMRGGVSGDGRFARLAAKLDLARHAGFEPDTLYLSNVPWMLAQPHGFFGEDHSQFLPEEAAGGAITRVRANLAEIAPFFRNVVCAIHYAPHSRPGDLHWETRLLTPGEFIADASWRELIGLQNSAGALQISSGHAFLVQSAPSRLPETSRD
jgi:hypothetical protein